MMVAADRQSCARIGDHTPIKLVDSSLLARWLSSCSKDGHFSEMRDFRPPVFGGNLHSFLLSRVVLVLLAYFSLL